MSQAVNGTVVLLITDFFFISKVEAPLAVLGLETVLVTSVESFLTALRKFNPTLAIVDLGIKYVDPIQAISAAKADPETRGVPLLCFGSHVNVERLKAAEEAGAESVVSSGEFSAHLPTLVGEFMD